MVNRDDVVLVKSSKSTSFKPPDEIVKFQVHPTDPNKTAALALEALSEALAAEELTALCSTGNRDNVILDKRSKSTSFKPADEIVKFQVHPTDPTKTASIGAQLNPDVDAALRELLRENWDFLPGTLQTCQESHAGWPSTA